MFIDRRKFISALTTVGASRLFAQTGGIASRNVKAQDKRPNSGRPFSRFVDVAHDAGLTAPVVYGEVNRKQYILEANGCGCAFIDFDNDGWMDIFVLGGTRLDGPPPGATNRLYKNTGMARSPMLQNPQVCTM